MENENVPTTPTTVEVVPQKNNKKQIVLIASISVLVIAIIIVAAYFMLLGDNEKLHPDLIPYEELEDSEKEYDRITSMETLKLIKKLVILSIN